MAKRYCPVSLGYTLIELMVVIGIMSVLSTIGFFAMRSTNDSDALDLAQKEMISNLRTTQNKILAATGGIATRGATINVGSATYNIDNVSYPLGKIQVAAITANNNSLGTVNLCFVNVNLSDFVQAPSYPNCQCNHSFACDGNHNSVSSPIKVTLQTQNGQKKYVIIEGSGIFVNRIYDQ